LNIRVRFWKHPQISDFMKIRLVGAKVFHADGQTDMAKVVVAFRNSANSRKKMEAMHVLHNVGRGVGVTSLQCK
jgi:hypothetical protein